MDQGKSVITASAEILNDVMRVIEKNKKIHLRNILTSLNSTKKF